jgi:signal transduction histidine kinase
MPRNVGESDGLTARLVAAFGAKQEELERVARVLHEDVGQVLTVTGLHLGILRQDNPHIGEQVEEIQQLLERAIVDVRQLSYQLNPGMVPRSGLRYALDSLIGRIREESGANVRFLMDSHVHVPQPVAVALFDIAEQALRNSVQHAAASKIEVVLQPAQEHVRLEIRDNGKGFDANVPSDQGLGFLWMDYKARQAGVTLSVESTPGTGTTVQVMYKEPAGEQVEQEQKDTHVREHGEVKGYAIRDPLSG